MDALNPEGDLQDKVGLPAHIADWPPVADLIDRMRELIAKRGAIETQRGGLQDRVKELDGNWASVLGGTRAKQGLSDFLASCRGDTKGLAGSDLAKITETCLDAYEQEQERAGGVWWSTLSRQIPAGVLLMFLLVTLGDFSVTTCGWPRSMTAGRMCCRWWSRAVDGADDRHGGRGLQPPRHRLRAERLDAGAMRIKLAEAEIQLAETTARVEAADDKS